MAKRTSNKTKKALPPYSKHALYEEAVQDPEVDTEFLVEKFVQLRHRKPLSMREDFCGTGFLSTTWVKSAANRTAVGIDLDPDPLEYGQKIHMEDMTAQQKLRMKYLQKDVLTCNDVKTDIIVAQNFSYCIFKTRAQLRDYFSAVRKSMKKDSVFFFDVLGGWEAAQVAEEEKDCDGNFKYYWDCDRFNPITNEGLFYIHFKRKGEAKRKFEFVYDWRIWSIPEIREILEEAGFSKSIVYWEGDDPENETGNGEFEPTDVAEDSEVWVNYMAALP